MRIPDLICLYWSVCGGFRRSTPFTKARAFISRPVQGFATSRTSVGLMPVTLIARGLGGISAFQAVPVTFGDRQANTAGVGP